MPVYESSEKAAAVFGQLFEILGEDENFTSRLRETGLSVRMIHTKPDCEIYVSPDKVVVGESIPDNATITIKMSCDTAHSLWLGKLMVPTAVATGRLTFGRPPGTVRRYTSGQPPDPLSTGKATRVHRATTRRTWSPDQVR